MSNEKAACLSCGAEILAVTAKFNAGLCGICKRDKEETEYQRVKTEKREAEKSQGLHYDIDSLLVGPDYLSAMDGALPESDDALYELLSEDEKTLQALVEFDRRGANGFGWLLDNAYYELVDKAHQAARHLEPTLLLSAFDELKTLLDQYGFPKDSSQGGCFYWEQNQETRDAFDGEIVKLDSKYFHYHPSEPTLYADSAYHDSIKRWVGENIETFRSRKE